MQPAPPRAVRRPKGSVIANADSWELRNGGLITPELTAVKLLGGGIAYEAYLAFDEFTYSPVVVKVIRPSLVTDDGTRRGLNREVAVLEAVNHPGVVRILRSGADDELRPHVVLEHVEGPRLSSLIRRHGPLQPQQYLPLVIDLASALHYFGNLGLVHLDVKPSNIIMGAPARLIDLSVARYEERSRTLQVQVGTDSYMSPEQVQPEGPHRPSYASDVWGVGATLFEAASGQKAFPGGVRKSDDVSERFPQLTGRPAAIPRQTPAPVAALILACLQPNPADRPRPHEITAAVEPLLGALPKPKLTFKVRV